MLKKAPMIEIVVAFSEENIIGNKGKLPWGRVPRDLARFKEITMEHTVVMGYNTLVSIGRILPDRTNLVLTGKPKKIELFPGSIAVSDIDTILEWARHEKVFIIGGEIVYRQFLPYATVAHITEFLTKFEGDARFPWLSQDEWSLRSSTFHPPDKKNKYPMNFQTWVRREYEEEKMAA